jgi:hypothetical protein
MAEPRNPDANCCSFKSKKMHSGGQQFLKNSTKIAQMLESLKGIE